MRWKISSILVALIILLLTVPTTQAMQMAAPVPSDWAYVSGIVTFNGEPKDGVYVRIPGGSQEGSTFTTRDGGYYKISTYPRLVTSIEVSYHGFTMTRSVETGGEGSNTTFNFDLTGVEATVAVTPTPLPQTVVLTGTVMYDHKPLGGASVNVSPITVVKTDSTGHYMTVVPTGQNLTITAITDGGSVSKNVTSPTEGTSFTVDLTAYAPSVTPQVTANTGPTVTPIPLPPASGNSESVVILSAIGLLAAIGLIRLRKE
jgi:hypothetical protein